MMLANKLMGGTAPKLYVDDVFSTYLYTGNGSTQTINNGIDLAGEGGLVWIKSRNPDGTVSFPYHYLSHSARGSDQLLCTDRTDQERFLTEATFVHLNTGFRVKEVSGWWTNTAGINFASWTFRNADKFYNHAVVTKSVGSNATVSFPNLGTLGMVRVKRTDTVGSWYVWHRSLTAGQLLIGETTAVETPLGHITVSGTTVTLVNGVIADGTYLVEAFAHDPSEDGIIQCGSFTGNGAVHNATTEQSGPEINLGWEPQYVMIKNASAAGGWWIFDTMRGFNVNPNGPQKGLYANTSGAEISLGTSFVSLKLTNTGFKITAGTGAYFNETGNNYIYMAVRRPNKPPTSGTQVYNAIARTGNGVADRAISGVGFAPDFYISSCRNSADYKHNFGNRLVGAGKYLNSAYTYQETSTPDFLVQTYGMDGVTLGPSDGINGFNLSGYTYIEQLFRRATGFFDVVCYTGDGADNRSIGHNLGVAPELIIVKKRNLSDPWVVYNKDVVNGLYLNDTQGEFLFNFWGDNTPTASNFYVNGSVLGHVNGASHTFVAYLFASLPGISKVFSFTGNGTNQNVECGFSAGARFVLLKRTDAPGGWLVADSARGIVAGNDPSLALNSTAAEVTSVDWIDPYSGGFNVVQESTNNANVNGATYIGLAIA